MSSIERRKHHRITVSAHVDVHSASNFYSAKTRDLSEGGLFVETQEEHVMGAAVHLCLALHGKKYDIHGEVAWVLGDAKGRQIGFGVRFTEVKRSVRKAILSFMRQRAPMPFGIVEPEEAPAISVAPASEIEAESAAAALREELAAMAASPAMVHRSGLGSAPRKEPSARVAVVASGAILVSDRPRPMVGPDGAPLSLPNGPRSVDDWEPVPSSALDSGSRETLPTGVLPYRPVAESAPPAMHEVAAPAAPGVIEIVARPKAAPPPLPWTPSCRPPARDSRPPRYMPGSEL